MSLKLKGKLFQNIEELKEAVFEVWEEISNKLIFTFIDKIKAKIIWVAENNGNYTLTISNSLISTFIFNSSL